MGTALCALEDTFAPDLFQNILHFLDDSSHIAVCGPVANDIAIMTDLDGCGDGPFTRMENIGLQTYGKLYQQAMSDDLLIAWRECLGV